MSAGLRVPRRLHSAPPPLYTDQTHIHFDGCAYRPVLEPAFLEDAEELGLELGWNFADFVEQDGAVVGQFEAAVRAWTLLR